MPKNRPGIIARTAAAWKAMQMVWSGSGGQWGSGGVYNSWYTDTWQPGARWRYEEDAGPLWLNSALFACLNWISLNFPEARLCVKTPPPPPDPGAPAPATAAQEQEVAGHPLTALLDRPNPYYSGTRLWMATVLSWVVDGNAYWFKARGSAGRGTPLELWWLPHWALQIAYPQDGSEYISHYVYTVNGRQLNIPRENIVHFRNGVDPANDRKGLSPIMAGIRQITGDNDAAGYTSAILRNMGIMGGFYSPMDKDVELDKDEAQILKLKIQEVTTGERRGEPVVARVPMRRDAMALSPEDVALNSIINYFEERICALMLISPMVVGLGSGLDRSTFTNYHESREAAFENCIVPMQRLMADELQSGLLADLSSNPQERLRRD